MSSTYSLPDLTAVSTHALEQVWDGSASRIPEHEQREHIRAVTEILQTNISNGRWRYATGAADGSEALDACLQEYGLRVATYYCAEHERVAGLVAGDAELWNRLRERLKCRAYHMLCRRGPSLTAAVDRAYDYAQEACQRILSSRYPYDVPFDAWATRILTNCVLKQGRSLDLLDRGMLASLDEELLIQDSSGENPEEWKVLGSPQKSLENGEDRHLLLNAIAQLPSEAQRQVILLGFFRGWEISEIAEALGKTCQAVYNLRYQALHRLRKVLGQQGFYG